MCRGVIEEFFPNEFFKLNIRHLLQLLRAQHMGDADAYIRGESLFSPLWVGKIGSVDPHEHEGNSQPPIKSGAVFHDRIGAAVRRKAAFREDDHGESVSDHTHDPDAGGHVAGKQLFGQDSTPLCHRFQDRPRAIVFIDKVTGIPRVRYLRNIVEILKGSVVA